MTPELIDIGVNLSDAAFDKDRSDVVKRTRDAGVTTMVLTGTTLTESQVCLKLAEHAIRLQVFILTTPGMLPLCTSMSCDLAIVSFFCHPSLASPSLMILE